MAGMPIVAVLAASTATLIHVWFFRRADPFGQRVNARPLRRDGDGVRCPTMSASTGRPAQDAWLATISDLTG
jgi:hypothetical protein